MRPINMYKLLCYPLTALFYMFQMFCYSFQQLNLIQKRKQVEHFKYKFLKRKN